jgi:hypothetical protein
MKTIEQLIHELYGWPLDMKVKGHLDIGADENNCDASEHLEV